MPDKTTSFPLAYRHGYAAPCLLKEADEGLMGNVRDKVEGNLLSEKNILKFGPMVSKDIESILPALTGKSDKPKSGFFGKKNSPGWMARIYSDYLAPTVKDKPTPKKRALGYATYGMSGRPEPYDIAGYATVTENPRVYKSEQGGGLFLRFDPNAADARKVYENYILPRYPNATFNETVQLVKDLGGNRLPADEGAQKTVFSQALYDAYQKKDRARLNRLSHLAAQSPYADEVKKELFDKIRSEITGKVSKVLPYAAGAAAMLPLASLLMSRGQQPQPQRQVQAKPEQNMLSESVYRRLGQNQRPVRLS